MNAYSWWSNKPAKIKVFLFSAAAAKTAHAICVFEVAWEVVACVGFRGSPDPQPATQRLRCLDERCTMLHAMRPTRGLTALLCETVDARCATVHMSTLLTARAAWLVARHAVVWV